MTLNFKIANQSSCMTLRPKILCHHAKFDYRRFSSWRHYPDEHLPEFWYYFVTLTTTEQTNLFTKQSTLWWCTIKPGLAAKGSAVQIINSHILIILFLTVTLAVKTANQSFRKTIWLIMMHHHIPSLVVKGTAIQKISSRQTFIGILKFCCDLVLEHNNPISP